MQGHNGKPRPSNKLGELGISVSKDGKYRVAIRGVYLGRFVTLAEAVERREQSWQHVEQVKQHRKEKGIIEHRRQL
jgi:hypothetical protein